MNNAFNKSIEPNMLDGYITDYKEIKQVNNMKYEIQYFQNPHENEYIVSEMKNGELHGKRQLFMNGLLQQSWIEENGKKTGEFTIYKDGIVVLTKEWSSFFNNSEERFICNKKNLNQLIIRDRQTQHLIYKGESQSNSMNREGKGYCYDRDSGILQYYGVFHDDKLVQIIQEFKGDTMIEYAIEENKSNLKLIDRHPVYYGHYIYDSTAEDYKYHGYGVEVDSSSGIAIREGEWTNGILNTSNTLYSGWYNKGREECSLRERIKICNGVFYSIYDSNKLCHYEGLFENELPNGKGIQYNEKNEWVLDGQWKNGLFISGKIRLINLNYYDIYEMDSVISKVPYLQGIHLIDGIGKYTHFTMNNNMEWTFTGEIKNNQCSKGELIKDNTIYNGVFVNNELYEGTIRNPSTEPGVMYDIKRLVIIDNITTLMKYQILQDNSVNYQSMEMQLNTSDYDRIIIDKINKLVIREKKVNKVIQMEKYTYKNPIDTLFANNSSSFDIRIHNSDITLLETKVEENGTIINNIYKSSLGYVDIITNEIRSLSNQLIYKGKIKVKTNSNGSLEFLREGKGKEYCNGELCYSGEWKNNVHEGKGKEYHNGQLCYNGEWKNNSREGKGKEYCNDKCCYNGEWKNNMKTGYGEGIIDDGKYKGYWEKNKREGFGEYTDSHGNVLKGQWENDAICMKIQEYTNGEIEKLIKVKNDYILSECISQDKTYEFDYIHDPMSCKVKNMKGVILYEGKVKDIDECINENAYFVTASEEQKSIYKWLCGTRDIHINSPFFQWSYIPHGYGKEYNKKGHLIYEGTFSFGLRSGYGTEYNDKGEKLYKGDFKFNKRV